MNGVMPTRAHEGSKAMIYLATIEASVIVLHVESCKRARNIVAQASTLDAADEAAAATVASDLPTRVCSCARKRVATVTSLRVVNK